MKAKLTVSRDSVLHGWLFALIFLPALAFFPGGGEGFAFVLYREPKGVVLGILGWLGLALLAWLRNDLLRLEPWLAELSRPAVWCLALFLGWMATTIFWVEVVPNYLYELRQLLLLFPWLIALLVWSRRDDRVRETVELALLAVAGCLTVIAFFQDLFPSAILTPIDPQFGVENPSLMGYKNPMAHVLAGQIFLLAWRIVRTRRRAHIARTRWRTYKVLWAALLIVELIYLASLQSRTAYAAVLGGTVAWIVLAWWRAGRRPTTGSPPSRLPRRAHLLAIVLVFVGAGAALFLHPTTRDRAVSTAALIADPETYLESDRGLYLRNTLNMARHRPFGVGLGDWQTQYPLYRLHERHRFFDLEHQVRRAHSDHVQILGEGGWPGLVLWGLFLMVTLLGLVRRFLRQGTARDLFLGAQLIVWIFAMATDYVIEMPWHKAQFFFVLFLVLAPSSAERPSSQDVRPERGARWPRRAAAVVITLVALFSVAAQASQAVKIRLAADLRARFQTLVGEPSQLGGRRALDAAVLAGIVDDGFRLALLPGHTKDLHRDLLIAAQSAALLGQDERARQLTVLSLRLHPYYLNALRLMADLQDDPDARQRWQRAFYFVLRLASRGFEPPYPLPELLRRGRS